MDSIDSKKNLSELPLHKRPQTAKLSPFREWIVSKKRSRNSSAHTRLERLGQSFVDHITPLECRGADAPFNMQWQTIADGKAEGCRLWIAKRRLSTYIWSEGYFRLLFVLSHPTALLCPYASPSSSTSSARPGARSARPVFPALHADDRCCRPLFSAACAEPSEPTDHRKSSLAPFGVFGSDRRTSSGNERHAALQTLARCLRCLREDHARPLMHPTSRGRTHRTQLRYQVQHCEDTRPYLTKDCLLAPLSAAAADKSAWALAAVAGLIAAVKLARVESAEIQNRSPRVRFHHLGVHYDCPHGGRGQQSEVMTWKQAKAEALRLVDDAARNRAELHLTEYQTQERYLADHPTGRTMGDHNLIVRAAMREVSRRGIYCHRRLVR
jgi:hypothetical protein